MKRVKLEDIGYLSRGKSKHRPRNDPILYNGNYPFIQTSDIKNANHILRNYSQTYNEVGLKQSKLWKKNTICITIAANIADTAILDFDACFPDSIIGLEIDPLKANFHYIEYLLQDYKKTIQNQSNGTSQENINIETFSNVSFNIPDLKEQEQIAKILSSLDDKIELNNKINQELEAMAKTIYDYWFVQFDFPDSNGKPYKSSGGKMVYNEVLKREIPEGWEADNILNKVNWISSSQPPKSTFNYKYEEGYIRFIQNRDYTDNANITYIKNDKNNKVCDEYDIMIDKYGDAGRVRFGLAGAFNVALAKIEVYIKNGQEYIRKVLESDYIYKYLYNACIASTRASLNSTILNNINICIPPDQILSKFERITKNIITKVLKCKQENQKLAELRDFLLPMLMNGQVSVKEDNKIINFKTIIEVDKMKKLYLFCKIIDMQKGKIFHCAVRKEKLLYLIETSIEAINSKNIYNRHIAGPYDSEFNKKKKEYRNESFLSHIGCLYHYIKINFRKAKDGKEYVEYAPDFDFDKAINEYNKIFNSINNEIEDIINYFLDLEKENSYINNFLESFATVFAIWNDFIIDGVECDDNMIINDVLNNWNDSKREVGDEIYWRNILNIVKKSKYKPMGLGNKTIINGK